jgi:alkanesulfonate monooxygenase
MRSASNIEVFSTCPPSADTPGHVYRRRVADVARWSEEAGCRGILVYSDNSLVDPWLLSAIIIQETRALSPLVAIQPVYMHPYWVAKQIASLGHLYGRKLYLNMVAGGFKNDLEALNDLTPHDQRYARLVEYTAIITRLLASPAGVTFEGAFHTVRNLRMTPPLPAALQPTVFVSGSSDAGVEASRALGATAIRYPKRAAEEERPPEGPAAVGVRVGVIARERESDAWAVARARFPEDRKGQLMHQLAMKTSDSSWHRQLSAMAEEPPAESPYWLVPFQNYKTMCPYLVGSYDTVGRELAGYIALGYSAFILDVPPDRDELRHTAAAFDLARQAVAA